MMFLLGTALGFALGLAMSMIAQDKQRNISLPPPSYWDRKKK